MRHHYERLTMWLTYDWIYIDFCMTCDQMDNFSILLLNFLVRIYNVLSYFGHNWYISWIHLSSMLVMYNVLKSRIFVFFRLCDLPKWFQFNIFCEHSNGKREKYMQYWMTWYKNSIFNHIYTMIGFSVLCLPKEVNLTTPIVMNRLLVC